MLEDDFSVALLEDDQREFEAGMVVSTTKSGRKINCCEQLLKQCLELIDRYGKIKDCITHSNLLSFAECPINKSQLTQYATAVKKIHPFSSV